MYDHAFLSFKVCLNSLAVILTLFTLCVILFHKVRAIYLLFHTLLLLFTQYRDWISDMTSTCAYVCIVRNVQQRLINLFYIMKQKSQSSSICLNRTRSSEQPHYSNTRSLARWSHHLIRQYTSTRPPPPPQARANVHLNKKRAVYLKN